jgi:uncharacterized MnhB-related membrane protein
MRKAFRHDTLILARDSCMLDATQVALTNGCVGDPGTLYKSVTAFLFRRTIHVDE